MIIHLDNRYRHAPELMLRRTAEGRALDAAKASMADVADEMAARYLDDIDLIERVTMWRNELLDTVPFDGRRILLLDQILRNLTR